MSAAASPAGTGLRLDQATVVSAAAVLALIGAIFAGLGVLPDNLAFIGKVGEVFAPLLCVPVFSRFREALIARKVAVGIPVDIEPSGYRFLSYALIATLLLFFLGALFNVISVLQKSLVIQMLQDEGVALSPEAAATANFGDGVVVLPLLFLASVAIGWSIHKGNVPRPALCLAAIFVLMLVVRSLHLVLATDFVHLILSEGAKLGYSPVVTVVIALAVWPVVTLLGTAAGYTARALFLTVSRLAVDLWARSFAASPAAAEASAVCPAAWPETFGSIPGASQPTPDTRQPKPAAGSNPDG